MFGSQAKPQAEEGRATMSPNGPVTETTSQAIGGAPAHNAKTLEAKGLAIVPVSAARGFRNPSSTGSLR